MQHEHSAPTVAEASDGYERYFGLAESPFKLTSSPRFLFESASYRAALKEIDYALSRREQIIVVTGPIGTGKTTLCRMIAERRGPRTVVATISRPPETVDDLFRQVLDTFGLLTEDTKSILEASHFGLQKILRQAWHGCNIPPGNEQICTFCHATVENDGVAGPVAHIVKL